MSPSILVNFIYKPKKRRKSNFLKRKLFQTWRHLCLFQNAGTFACYGDNMKKMTAVIAGLALPATLALSALPASALEITSYDNGNYRSDGLHSGGNTTPFAGFTGFGGTPFPAAYEHRSFYAFDLAGLSLSAPVASISVTFFGRGNFVTDTGSETIGIYDYTGSVSSLVAGSTVSNPFGDQAFADLGTGLLAEHTITALSNTAMSEFTVALNDSFITQFNEALLGEGKIALGAALTSGAYFTAQGFWGNTPGIGAARLNITEAVSAVPEPASLLLLAGGLAALGLRRRKYAAPK